MAIERNLRSGSKGQSSPVLFEVMLSADLNAISPVVRWIMRLVSDLEYPVGKEFEIESAVREALTNIALRGCKGDPSKRVKCFVTGDKDRGIVIVVRDPGHGFDLADVAARTSEEILFSSHGRGVYLINTLMEEVKYEANSSEIHITNY